MRSHDALLRCVASVVGLGVGASLSMWVFGAARYCLVLCIKPHPFANEVKGHVIIITFAPPPRACLYTCKLEWADLSFVIFVWSDSYVWNDVLGHASLLMRSKVISSVPLGLCTLTLCMYIPSLVVLFMYVSLYVYLGIHHRISWLLIPYTAHQNVWWWSTCLTGRPWEGSEPWKLIPKACLAL